MLKPRQKIKNREGSIARDTLFMPLCLMKWWCVVQLHISHSLVLALLLVENERIKELHGHRISLIERLWEVRLRCYSLCVYYVCGCSMLLIIEVVFWINWPILLKCWNVETWWEENHEVVHVNRNIVVTMFYPCRWDLTFNIINHVYQHMGRGGSPARSPLWRNNELWNCI